MNTLGWIMTLMAVLVVAGLAFLTTRKRRTARLRRRFGPEYDRAVQEAGNRREAEGQLADVAGRRDHLIIRLLDTADRSRYSVQWEAVQTRFVDEPARAVRDADALITSVLRDRGYPVEDFDERTSLVALDHPGAVQHYLAARRGHVEQLDVVVPDTEKLREAFVHYRDLFDAVVGGEELTESRQVTADRTARHNSARQEQEEQR